MSMIHNRLGIGITMRHQIEGVKEPRKVDYQLSLSLSNSPCVCVLWPRAPIHSNTPDYPFDKGDRSMPQFAIKMEYVL